MGGSVFYRVVWGKNLRRESVLVYRGSRYSNCIVICWNSKSGTQKFDKLKNKKKQTIVNVLALCINLISKRIVNEHKLLFFL